MDTGAASRIARRVMLAYSYRTQPFADGCFGKDGARPGILLLNYRKFPAAFAYEEGDGTFVVSECRTDSDAFDDLMDSSWDGNGFVRDVRDAMADMDDGNVSGFRYAVLDKIYSDFGVDSDAGEFLAKSSRKMGKEEALDVLSDEYDVSMKDFSNTFGCADDSGRFDTVDADGFHYILHGCSLSADEVRRLSSMVRRAVPAVLSSLCYGDVEIRRDLNRNAGGDYDPSEDVIRVGDDAGWFVRTMLHELGHRWSSLVAEREQINAFRKAFRNANGRDIRFSEGDLIEDESGNEYRFVAYEDGMLRMEDLPSGEEFLYRVRHITNRIVSLNGAPVDKFHFPNAYSMRNVDEFISECFSECYCGNMEDKDLEEFCRGWFES